MPAEADSKARMPAGMPLLTNRSNAATRLVTARNGDYSRAKMIDLTFKPPAPMRRAQTLVEMPDDRSNSQQNSVIPCACSNGLSSRLMHRQRMERLLKPKEVTVAKAFSYPSVLACKAADQKTYTANTARLTKPAARAAKAQAELESELEEQQLFEEFQEKKLMIISWLYEADFSERPPTPPSRYEDYVDPCSPVQVETAIHIVYNGDS